MNKNNDYDSDEIIEDVRCTIDIMPEQIEKVIKKKAGRPSKDFDIKVWRRNNKETVNAYGARKVKCDLCNIEIRYDSMRQHNKSSKHLKRVNSP